MAPKQILACLGALGLLIGSFLDWTTVSTGFGTVGVAGTHGDGVLTAAAAGLALIMLLTSPTRRGATVGGICCLIGGLIAGYDYTKIKKTADQASTGIIIVQVGTGLYLCIAGAVLGAVGAALWDNEMMKANTAAIMTILDPPA